MRKINICIPANIRFAHYPTWEKVKFENKFAPVSLTIPINKDLNQALKEVPRVTSTLRSQLFDVYAAYAMTFYTVMITPYWILNWFSGFSTRPFTLSFSNVPGLIKPITFQGRKSIMMSNYILPVGKTGLTVSCLSYVDWLKIGCVADDAVMRNP